MRKHWSMRWRTPGRLACGCVGVTGACQGEYLARHRPDIVLVAQQTVGAAAFELCNSSTAYLR